MSQILHDASTNDIIRAMEANWRENRRSWRMLPTVEIRDDKTFFWFSSGLPYTWLNQVLLARLTNQNVDAEIAAAHANFVKRGFPWGWTVGPSSTPNELPRRLQTYGFSQTNQARGMAISLDDALLAEYPNGVTIFPVIDAKTLTQWKYVIMNDTETGPPLMTFAQQVQIESAMYPGKHHFVALFDKVPVAIATVLFSDGVAGLYSVVTLPIARKKGIGTAITYEALRYAQQQGYRVAVLQTSRKGMNMYQEIGFKVYYEFPVYTLSTPYDS